jgi:UDP-2,4-diacetamido-2,4,6-trideoxy-beta-L-altropyranose hydrolase
VNSRVVFRCDGSSRIGLGHVVRCMAFAHAAAARGADVLFAMRPDAIANDLPARAGLAVEVLREGTADDVASLLALAPPGAWVVLDGYELPAVLGAELRRQHRRVLRIVDGPPCGEAELFVNANLHAPRAKDRSELHGPRFALLRPAFALTRPVRRPQAGPLALLLVFGGSDVAALTPQVVAWIGQHAKALPPLLVTAVLGPLATSIADTDRAAAASPVPTRVLVGPARIAEVMAEADLAITAAGGTVLELCALGVPSLVVTVADNQEGIAATIAARGAGLDLGGAGALTPAVVIAALARASAQRLELAAAARALVDGAGADRVVDAMERFCGRSRHREPSVHESP